MERKTTKIDVSAFLDKAGDAFALPQVLIEILRIVDNDKASADDLATIIMHDPSLTARLLKMANSSYYWRGEEVRTVNQAVMKLGSSMVKCLALSASVFQPEESMEDEGFDIRDLYSHFLGTAIAAKFIAEEVGFKSPEEAFVVGLLHDLGHILLLKVTPDRHVVLLRDYLYDESLSERERELYGTDHAKLGKGIAEAWNLPTGFASALEKHHRRLNQEQIDSLEGLDLIVAVADHVSGAVHSHGNRDVERHLEISVMLTNALKVSDGFISRVSAKLLSEIANAAEFLGLDIGDPMAIIQRANSQLFESYATIESLFKERQELSRRIIEEEHRIGAMRSRDIAIATLSHYINNAATIISGRTQLVEMMVTSGKLQDPEGKLGETLTVIDTSLMKIMAVLTELKALGNLENVEFYNDSDAINIDKNIHRRMGEMGITLDTIDDKPVLTERKIASE
jgi:HD-like signal output (HDOD) protein